MLAETFSESFSKWVRNGSSLQWGSYLILFGKSRNFRSKIGHEPPNFVPSHHFYKPRITNLLAPLLYVIIGRFLHSVKVCLSGLCPVTHALKVRIRVAPRKVERGGPGAKSRRKENAPPSRFGGACRQDGFQRVASLGCHE